MTTLLQRPDPVDLFAPERRRAPLAVAVVAGVCLGVVDLLLQLALPYPWANLANSSAVWALAAFGYGCWVARPGLRVALGGAVLLVVAVVAYYLAAVLIRNDDLAVLWLPNSLTWMAFGVLAGVVFGLAGGARERGGWWTALAAAAAGAVCFAEFAVDLVRVDALEGLDARYATDLVLTAVLVALLGLVALVATTGRSLPALGRALLLSVPLAVVGFVGFAAAGFTG